MNNLNLFTKKNKSFNLLRYVHIGQRLSLLTVIAVCLLCFMPGPGQTNGSRFVHINKVFGNIIPGDMVQDRFYFFSDHGSGMSVVQYDRTEGSNIYTFAHIKPVLSVFEGPGLWGTVSDAGDIRPATGSEIAHLHRCILAGRYVP
ncbi:MAG: hypothetical protein Q8941_18765 [Bacteroidota bacterium]|nr:hypothetical protein [Bacteroidota bacterium]